MLYTLAISLFFLASLIQAGFLFLLRFREQSDRPGPCSNPIPVSIVICAKNESANLRQFLPFVLEQDYPEDLFEVIVVNDQSTDDSLLILKNLSAVYPQLKILDIPADELKTLPGKKYALSKGIAAAKYERLLLTDADCKPSSNQWLSYVSNSGAPITLGYGAYETHTGLLNQCIRWETVHACMQYASYAAIGLPYMGVGRNLSYDKSLLKQLDNNATFQEIYTQTPSGDDDLLIAAIANGDNTMVCLNKEAHTISIPQVTWQAWWRQKTRHSSTGKYYPQKAKALLGLYALSHSLYWFLGIPLLSGIGDRNFGDWNPAWGIFFLFFLRLMLYWANAAKWYRELNEQKLFLFYPLGDLGWAIYNVLLSPYIFWKNKQVWK